MQLRNNIRHIEREEIPLLLKIATRSFFEAHKNSAPQSELTAYMDMAFQLDIVQKEWADPKNRFHFILYDGIPVGYSKIIPKHSLSTPVMPACTKLERLYILEDYHNLKLGADLLKFNINLSKKLGGKGMWLYTWVENHRAIKFYERFGFKIIGRYDFKLSDRHSNPNHQMFLDYSNL